MAFQQNAFQHNAFQVGIAGAAPPVEPYPPIRRAWFDPNPWKNKPTQVFEQQNRLWQLVAATTQLRDAFFAGKAKTSLNQDFIGQNLLLTTLTVVAGTFPPGEQNTEFVPLSRKNLSFEYQNLLSTLLQVVVATLPEGQQEFPDSVWKYKPTIVFNQQNTTIALSKIFPVGRQLFDAKLWKYSPTIVFEDQDKHLTLFNPGFPSGKQSFDNKVWKYGPTQVFNAQNLLNTLLSQIVVYPVGKQLFDAVLQKHKTQQVWYDQNQQLTLLNPGFPIGEQLFDSELSKIQTFTYFEYQDLLNTVLAPPAGTGPTLLYDITTGRMALLLIDTTNPKIVMLL